MKGQLLLCPKLPSGWGTVAPHAWRAVSQSDTNPVNASEGTGEQEVTEKHDILPSADE